MPNDDMLDNHPIDEHIETIPGVRRVQKIDLAAGKPLQVIVLCPALGSESPTVMAIELDMTPAHDGVLLTPPDAMDPASRRAVLDIMRYIVGRPQPYYAMGMERCMCPPEAGGPRWNAMGVALLWQPTVAPHLHRLASAWTRAIATETHRFCGSSVAMYLGLA